MLLTDLHPGWMKTDVSLYLLGNPSACIVFQWMTNLFLVRFRFFTAVWIVRSETSARMFSDVAQIQLICLAYSFIS